MDIDNEKITLQINSYQELYPIKMHDTNLDDLAECVKQAQGSRSIRQFAAEVGTTPSTISRILNKKILEPSEELIIKIGLNADTDSGVTVEKLLAICGRGTRSAMMRDAGSRFEREAAEAISQYLKDKGYTVRLSTETRRHGRLRYDFIIETDALSGKPCKWAFDVKLILPMSPLGSPGTGRTRRLLDSIFANFYVEQNEYDRVSVIVNHREVFEQLKKQLSNLSIRDSFSIVLVAGSSLVDEFVVTNSVNNTVVLKNDREERLCDGENGSVNQ